MSVLSIGHFINKFFYQFSGNLLKVLEHVITVFLEFPVSNETLSRLILGNEFESDIFKVNFTCVLLLLLIFIEL